MTLLTANAGSNASLSTEDLGKIRTKLQHDLDMRSSYSEQMLSQFYDKWDMDGAMQASQAYIGSGLFMQEKSVRDATVPVARPAYSRVFLTAREAWGAIPMDGSDLRKMVINPVEKYSRLLLQSYSVMRDERLIEALCAPMRCGDECANEEVPLGSDNFLNGPAGDGLPLTSTKIRAAADLLRRMDPGSDEPICFAMSPLGMSNLATESTFQNNDFLQGQPSFANAGLHERSWYGVNFKLVDDYRIDLPGKDKAYKPVLKTQIDHYGTGQHLRYGLMWRKSGLAVGDCRPFEVRVFEEDVLGKSFGSYRVQAQADFGATRTDNCKVVVVPYLEENPSLSGSWLEN